MAAGVACQSCYRVTGQPAPFLPAPVNPNLEVRPARTLARTQQAPALPVFFRASPPAAWAAKSSGSYARISRAQFDMTDKFYDYETWPIYK